MPPNTPQVSQALQNASRGELIAYYDHCRDMEREWLRRQIIDNNRIDILAISVLGYQVRPFHLGMMQWQFRHKDSLQLAFRGAGKSTTCTITKVIHYLCKSRDYRIAIASKTTSNAEGFLKEIKAHLEENVLLAELFGLFYDPRRVPKWDNKEIEVLGRKRRAKESSVTCVGVEGTIVSKHFDIILSDDLVDEDNSRTKYMRDKTKSWYYQVLDPCLEPPDPDLEHRGEHHRLGTRYHFDDLWGHLLSNELKESTQIIPALDDQGRSPWPEKYPPKWFEEKKRRSGTIIFRAQYICDTEAMKGEVFQWDDMQVIEDRDLPGSLRIFQGTDLAISEKDKDDMFAHVTIGLDKVGNIYVLHYYEAHLRFGAQTDYLRRSYRKHDPIRSGVEANAYQLAQYQTLKDGDKDMRVKPVFTDKDKRTRAWKLSAYFEDRRVFFRRGLGALMDQIVLFPSFRYRDGLDALDIAVRTSRMKRKKRKRRSSEPGLL
jgi:phage terminase large subunit-like protein